MNTSSNILVKTCLFFYVGAVTTESYNFPHQFDIWSVWSSWYMQTTKLESSLFIMLRMFHTIRDEKQVGPALGQHSWFYFEELMTFWLFELLCNMRLNMCWIYCYITQERWIGWWFDLHNKWSNLTPQVKNMENLFHLPFGYIK